MTTAEHRAKTAALLAHVEGELSEEGERRLTEHLAGCTVCRTELAAIHAYEGLLEDARSLEPAPIPFDRMELALAREAREIVSKRSASMGSASMGSASRTGIWAALGAAAAALLVVAGSSITLSTPLVASPDTVTSPDTDRVAPRPDTVAEADLTPRDVPLIPIVTLAAGRSIRNDLPIALEPGDELAESDRIRSEESSELHVRLSDGTGLIAYESTELELTRTRVDAVRLTLLEGRVGSSVAPLRSSQTYIVLAAGYQIAVHGTRFTVSNIGANLDAIIGVDLAEGRVEVTTPTGERILLEAPARWSSDGSREASSEHDVSLHTGTDGTFVRFDVSGVQGWQIDDRVITVGAPVRLALTPGEHRVQRWTLSGTRLTDLVQIGGEPMEIAEGTLTPEPPQIRAGHLEDDEIAPVVRRGMRRVQGCYQRGLARNSRLGVRSIHVRITLDAMGNVRRARVRGLSDATDTAECIQNYTQRWVFPPPGGPVSYDLPIQLAPTQ